MCIKNVHLVFIKLCIFAGIFDVIALEGEGIVGGKVSAIGEHPYHVSIQQNGKHVCGGAILDEFHVVTAAHCLVQLNPLRILTGHIQVLCGVNYLNESSTGEVSDVAALYVPKEYFMNFTSQKTGDIAVLKLKQMLNLNENPYINNVVLSLPLMDYDGKSAVVTGFGMSSMSLITDLDTNTILREGTKDGMLNYADAVILSNEECSTLRAFRVTESRLCARITGFDDVEVQGVCFGDSGGPLVVDGNVLVGIVSSGPRECDESVRPTIYTRVSSFLDFILGVFNDDPSIRPVITY